MTAQIWGRLIGTAAILVSTGTAVSPVYAGPIDPINDRTPQIAVNVSPTDGPNLQTLLNSIFATGIPAPNALTEQSWAAMWRGAATDTSVNPQLKFEYFSDAANTEIGLFSGDDTTGIHRQAIFNGPAVGGTKAAIEWDGDSMYVGSANFSNCSGSVSKVACGEYANSGINPSAFGFYLKVGGNAAMYTADQLNGGAARALVFQGGSSTNWVIAFDTDGDRDFNDTVLYAESLLPVPEPGTLVLFGSGLLGLTRLARRKSPVA